MENLSPITLGLLGSGFTFLMTALGAAVVFFFKKEVKENFRKIFLGFAAGVMIAASVWSLLIPAIEEAQLQGWAPYIPAAGGFILGGVFFLLLDSFLPHLHPGSDEPEGIKTNFHKTTMMVIAVTLHNIPEGMAVGLAFAVAAGTSDTTVTLASAAALALGIGIQNFPEGAAISLPLRQNGQSRMKSFIIGALSGIVEPIACVLTVLLAGVIAPAMPWLLSFAAGAMVYVVVEELIPEAHLGEHSNIGTIGVMAGFVIMMVLDVALG